MDPQHTGDMLNHLKKQNELLKEAHKSMTQELQKLEVEHEMMMRKLYELTNSHSVTKKKMDETQNVSKGREIVEVSSSTSIVTTDDEITLKNSSSIFPPIVRINRAGLGQA